jgi:hypothetical protein
MALADNLAAIKDITSKKEKQRLAWNVVEARTLY